MDRMFDVGSKTVLVTGGARGIGRMIAEGFVAAGADVIISSRNKDPAEQVAMALTERGQQGRCVAVTGNLGTEAGVDELAAAVRSLRGELHVLINNAGSTWGAPFENYPLSGFDRTWSVNVKAPFRLIQVLHPLLVAAGTATDPARVINVGSTDGILVPVSENYAYSASKAAIHHLTRQLAGRLARDNITVNTIAPGLFHTRMTQYFLETEDAVAMAARQIPLQRLGSPMDIAGAAIFLASRAGSYLTGAVLPVDGGVGTTRRM